MTPPRTQPAFLGVLMLETRFPRILGDIGHPASLGFPVRYAVVAGATPQRVVRGYANALLRPFVGAGRQLVSQGANWSARAQPRSRRVVASWCCCSAR